MKFSTSFILVSALVCAVIATAPHANTKHQSRKAAQTHHQDRSVAKPDAFDSASVKSAIDLGAADLNKALDLLTPLARDGFALCSNFTARVMNGPSGDKQGRANDANLLARADKFIGDASAAFKGLRGLGTGYADSWAKQLLKGFGGD